MSSGKSRLRKKRIVQTALKRKAFLFLSLIPISRNNTIGQYRAKVSALLPIDTMKPPTTRITTAVAPDRPK
jgi:hypothetical protein